MRIRWVVPFVVVLGGLGGLGLAAGPAPAAPAAFSCSPATGTLGGLAVLQHVTATTESGTDRIVFEFATLGAPAGVGATYALAAATPPFSEGASGKPLAVAGQSFVTVKFHNGYLVDPVNLPAQATYTGSQDLKPGLPLLTEAVVSDSFEGYLTWILGLQQKACWQVTQLTGPTRLVVELHAPALPVTGSPQPLVPLGFLGLAALAGGVVLTRIAVRRRQRAGSG